MCDTFVALSPATDDGSVIFGKNSDRDPNEAQVLEYHPAAAWPAGSRVQCTYIEIPQVRDTLAVLLSRPFWMWGAEIGANEKGVVIGNEAVWSKMPLIKTNDHLLGMDLLRLALERGSTAREALEVIIQLLGDHGQGGYCRYRKKRYYHNSFIIADPAEAWVLETAGPLWAAVRIKEFYTISNGLTIGTEIDEHHPELLATARRKGWLKQGDTFHFAHCYSDWYYTTFSGSHQRQTCSQSLVRDLAGTLDVAAAMHILRDHGTPMFRPDSDLLSRRICSHAANPLSRDDVQSTASMIAHLKPDRQTYWATGTSAPCSSIFKPLWFEGDVMPSTGPEPTAAFDPANLWWQHERLHRALLPDFQHRLDAYRHERDELEQSLIGQAAAAPPGSRRELTRQAFRQAGDQTELWLERVKGMPQQDRTRSYYRWYWKQQNRAADFPVD